MDVYLPFASSGTPYKTEYQPPTGGSTELEIIERFPCFFYARTPGERRSQSVMPPCPHFDLKIVQRSKHQSAVAAAPRPAGVRRPQYLVERRRSHRETMELPACPETGACHTEGYSPEQQADLIRDYCRDAQTFLGCETLTLIDFLKERAAVSPAIGRKPYDALSRHKNHPDDRF